MKTNNASSFGVANLYKRQIASVLLILSLSIAGFMYILSLKGGTFDYMKEHLHEIAFYLFSSVLIYLVTFNFILFTSILSRKIKAGLLIVWGLFLVVMYQIDHDDGMENHGYFNIIAFGLIVGYVELAIIALYTCVKLWLMIPRRFKKGVALILGVSFLIITVKLAIWYGRRQEKFNRGLFGQKMARPGPNTSTCHLDDTPVAWLDIIPPYIQNFWAGRWWCSGVSYVPEITFVGSQMQIYCPYSRDVHVEVIPSSLGWDKVKKRRLQQHMLIEKVNVNLKCMSRSKPAILDLDSKGVSPHESFRVTCASSFVEKHSRIVFRPRRKQSVVDRSQKILSQLAPKEKPLNVAIMFLDAVSRKHFERKFPLTIQVMESIYKDYAHGKEDSTGIFQFFRYHAVDFSTDDNTKALYLGKTKKSTPEHLRAERLANATVAPPIWFKYMDNGYVSARIDNFCEDWAFKYNGFLADADHEAVTPFCLPEYLKAANNVIDGPYGLMHRCLSGRFVHEYNFDYFDAFWDTYKDIPKFVTSAFIEGHEITGDIIEDVDADMAKFLRRMKSSGKLDDTILLIMSDHGLHSGFPAIFTPSGKIEHFNPLMYWFIPNRIVNKYNLKDNLMTNAQRLVTAFDIHETLKHILNLSEEPKPTAPEQYGESLFTNRISPKRTCADVKVPLQWCRCSQAP